MKYNASGDLMALGCKDNLIHILSVSKSYRHVACCRGHTSWPRNIDFSTDGTVIQSTDAARELLHWDAQSGQQITNAKESRNVRWATWTSLFGWPVQGILNGDNGAVTLDGEMNCVTRSKDGQLIVAGGSHTVNKAIKLFPFPCLSNAVPSLHGGHTSPVLDVAFTCGSTNSQSKSEAVHVLSAGVTTAVCSSGL
jgi:microtubule-associated protein-like 6